MTRALIVARAGRPFNSTMAPFLTGRVQRTAHPRRLTSITWHDSENGSSGSKLMSVIGSSQGTRVPPRVRAVLRDELTGRSSKADHCRILVWLTCDCFPRSQFVTAARKWHSTRPGLSLQGFAPRWNTRLQAIGPLEAPLLSIGLSHPVKVSGRMLCRSSAVPLIACNTEVGALQGFVPRRKRASGKSVGKTAILRATQASLRRSNRRRDRPVD
jgi:hypothetical protein